MSRKIMELGIAVFFLTLAAAVLVMVPEARQTARLHRESIAERLQMARDTRDSVTAAKGIVSDGLAGFAARSLQMRGLMSDSDADEIVNDGLQNISKRSPKWGKICTALNDAFAKEYGRVNARRGEAEAARKANDTRTALKQLGLGLLMYSTDYNGKFPPKLDLLPEQGYVKPGPGFAFNPSDYVYLAEKQNIRDDDKPSLMVAHVASPMPSGKYLALFVDGHVEEVMMERIVMQEAERKQ